VNHIAYFGSKVPFLVLEPNNLSVVMVQISTSRYGITGCQPV